MTRPRHILVPTLLLTLAGAGCEPIADDQAELPGIGGKTDDPAAVEHEIDVQSVWKEVSETPGKQYMAVLGEDLYSHSEQFLIFGEKEGNKKVRSFLGRFLIIEHAGNTETSEDNFYKLTAQFVTNDKVEIRMEGRDGRLYQLVYERQQDTDGVIASEAAMAANKFYDRYDALLAKEINTLSLLKAYVALHIRTHDYAPNEEDGDGLEWQFVFEWLQIEASLELGPPNDELAGVTIEQDGSDAVSQYFADRFGQGWTADEDIPDPEEALDGFEWDGPEPVYYTFESGITGVEPGPVRHGLEQFAEATVMAMNPFECEGGYDYVRDYYWVLADGSVLSYQTMPECD